MAAGKNTHLEHLEDEIINKGTQGGQQAIDILKEMGKFLSGNAQSAVSLTTKWDGAPAIVCGIDPEDGQFFVGTKSVFAKTKPKICKSVQDVQKLYDGALVEKLTKCYTYLKEVVKSGVLQGDLMFTDDKKYETIDGKRYIVFRPNTITYAAEVGSGLADEINKAKLGIVFHTKYNGKSLPEMTSSFNVKQSDFKKTPETWVQEAKFKNIGNAASFTTGEKSQYDAAVRKAEGSLRQTKGVLDFIQSGKKTLQIDTEFKKFFNNYVKNGMSIPSVETAYREFSKHLEKEFKKAIDKLKTSAAQQKKQAELIELLSEYKNKSREFKMLIATYMNLQAAKMLLVKKLKKISQLNLFVDMGNGDYKATTPEGFVAVQGRNAVKLIDRLEFSKLNFTVPKNW